MNRTTIGALATTAWLAALGGTALAAPANDDFENAQALGAAPVTVSGTLAGASSQPGDPGGNAANVWYSYTATASGPLEIELPAQRGAVDGPPRVYTGDHDHLVPAPVIDGNPWFGRTLIDAVAGQTYRIMVAGWEPDGRFELRVRPAVAPSNDDFADARSVRVPGLYEGTLEDATVELGEDVPRNAIATTWYRIRPRHSSRLTVEASGSRCLPTVDSYTGSRLSSLHRIAERLGTVRFQAVRGHTYLLRVSTRSCYLGDYTLDISDGSIKGKGVHMKAEGGQTIHSVRRHGLRLDVGARRKVGVSIELRISHRTMRRLHLRSTRIGRVHGQLGYHEDKVPATIRLNSAARRALSGRSRLDATLRLTLQSHGPNRVLKVPVHIPGTLDA